MTLPNQLTPKQKKKFSDNDCLAAEILQKRSIKRMTSELGSEEMRKYLKKRNLGGDRC